MPKVERTGVLLPIVEAVMVTVLVYLLLPVDIVPSEVALPFVPYYCLAALRAFKGGWRWLPLLQYTAFSIPVVMLSGGRLSPLDFILLSVPASAMPLGSWPVLASGMGTVAFTLWLWGFSITDMVLAGSFKSLVVQVFVSVLVWVWAREREEILKREAERRELALLGMAISQLAHEIKNSITALQGNIELAMRYNDISTLSEALEEVNRLAFVSRELLDFVRARRPRREPFPICEMAKSIAKSSGVELTCSEDVYVPMDPGDAKTVLENLLRNAKEAGARRVEIRVERRKGRAVVSIANDGEPIPPEEEGKIFRPFYTTKSRGTGLGLSIVERIVRTYSGAIAVKGRGRLGGAEFVITLPGTQFANIQRVKS